MKPDLRQMRLDILRMCHEDKKSHIGSSLSCVEILAAIYFSGIRTENTRVIISKGHAVAGVLAALKQLGIDGEHTEHTHKMEGVDWTTGSLGHGLSVGIGMAIAGRDVIVLCGDGEFDEGSCWEALGFLASHKTKGRLMLIVDYNRWGGYDRITPLLNYRLSGFIVPIEVDGHDLDSLNRVMSYWPKIILADTVKGKGVSFLEDRLVSHYTSLKDEEYKRAVKEVMKCESY